jgi:hypothetical protein
MRALLINVSLMGAALLGAIYVANSALSIPDMHVSNTTGECVKVINYNDTTYTCESQPTKYNHIWVK